MRTIRKNFTQVLRNTPGTSGISSLFERFWLGMRWHILRIMGPISHRGWQLRRKTACWLAAFYRIVFLRRVVFVGVTGSAGKTTTKELIAAVLSTCYKGRKNPDNRNEPGKIARTIFQVKPGDKFCVQEMAVCGRSVGVPGEPGFEQSIGMLKPQIGVVTNIGSDHISAFETVDKIAAEKGKLIAALPPKGVAILNADDEKVMDMQKRLSGRLITYGVAPEATIRAGDIHSPWPERLSFTVHYAGQSHPIQTQLCGEHWVHSVLAAIATGVAMDVPLVTIAEAIEMVPPFEGRLSPVKHPDEITFIRDDYKAPLWTVPPALDFLKRATAKRKIAVIGTLSDYRGDAAGQYVKVARQALHVADYVFFVGRWASRCLRARRHPQDEAVRAFAKVEDISEFLKKFLLPGDLVLLKGRQRLDNLVRIVEACSSWSFKPRTNESISFHGSDVSYRVHDRDQLLQPLQRLKPQQTIEVVVGLGNPGEQYWDTRHNVGQRVVDMIANSTEVEWVHEDDEAMVARIGRPGKIVYLIKSLTKINYTGQMLSSLAQRFGFGPSDCILIYDDIDLALGEVRFRSRGSAGGHNGVRSIIGTFQSEDFRRIKIGIGRPEHKGQVTEYVLGRFSGSECPKIKQVCLKASEQILKDVVWLLPA